MTTPTRCGGMIGKPHSFIDCIGCGSKFHTSACWKPCSGCLDCTPSNEAAPTSASHVELPKTEGIGYDDDYIDSNLSEERF